MREDRHREGAHRPLLSILYMSWDTDVTFEICKYLSYDSLIALAKTSKDNRRSVSLFLQHLTRRAHLWAQQRGVEYFRDLGTKVLAERLYHLNGYQPIDDLVHLLDETEFLYPARSTKWQHDMYGIQWTQQRETWYMISGGYTLPHRLDGPAEITRGETRWCWEGRLHRIDGPALIKGSTYCWYIFGIKHRERGAGPTELLSNGDRLWYIAGQLDRADGPAVIEASGIKKWYRRGLLHRTDGAAYEHMTQSTLELRWYLFDKLHRVEGPAILITPVNGGRSNKVEEYYLDGRKVTMAMWYLKRHGAITEPKPKGHALQTGLIGGARTHTRW